MASFLKSKKIQSKPAVERPKFFKRLDSFKPQESFVIFPKEVFHDKIFLTFTTIWALPIFAAAIYSALNFKSLPYQIPLFYSHAWGESQLADSRYIFLPAVGVLLLGIFNIIFSAVFHQQDKVFSYLLMGAASLISLLAAITTFNIINLVR